jgi:hypothetical protein
MKEKITFILMLVLLVGTVSGCVKKTEAPSGVAPVGLQKDSTPPASPTTQEEVLPKATGKVDDLVSAVSNEADSEKDALADEENAAGGTAADAEEINNLSNSYDENEL